MHPLYVFEIIARYYFVEISRRQLAYLPYLYNLSSPSGLTRSNFIKIIDTSAVLLALSYVSLLWYNTGLLLLVS